VTETETEPRGLPDLVVPAINRVNGGVEIIVRNAGEAPAGPSELSLGAPGKPTSTLPVAELAVDETVVISVPCSVSGVAARPAALLRATADGPGAVPESDETNNDATARVSC